MAHTQVVAGLNYRLVLSVKDKAKKHFNLEAVVFQVDRAGTAGGSRYRGGSMYRPAGRRRVWVLPKGRDKGATAGH